MDAGRQVFTAWSYGLAGFVYAAFAIYVASAWRSGWRSRSLFIALALCALWGCAGLAFALTGAVVSLAGSLLADILRFGGWYCFLLVLLCPDADRVRGRWLRGLALGLFVVGIGALLMAVLGLGVAVNPLRLALVDALAMSVLALVLVEQLLRNVSPDARWNIKPLCIGLGSSIVFDVYLYSQALLFNRIDIDAFSVRGFVHVLVVPLLAMSTLRSRDWKNRLVLSQRAALQSATLVAVGVYLLFMAAAGYYVRYFGGDWGRALQLALAFAGLLLLLVLGFSGALRAKLRVLVGKHFFSYRYDYREEWLRFTSALSAQEDFSEMGKNVVKAMAGMVESPAGALWLKDPSGQLLAQTACWNIPAGAASEPADSPLCRFLRESGWVIDLEEYRRAPLRYAQLTLPAWLLETPNAWLVVPLATGSGMIGFVVLATARTKIDVDWEVIDLLKTAGRQAGAFLGQMQATEALLEARKFDAFNRMSAFVVHDLKNIVAQLSLMLKNSERHRDNPEFQQDMLMTIEHSVERMRQLMMQLREGSTPVDSPRGIELAAVIRRVQTAKASQGREVDVEVQEAVVARGHEDRIERVIGHLVQNALDATEQHGRVSVRLERQGSNASISVNDSGHGMSGEFVRERLFKPFQTTKSAGMGIGAYESFQYVNELGGRVSVDSAIDVGTEVRLSLPLFDAGAFEARRA
ncbi:MAG: multi-sensor signal transduction histidine kinase [Proteobacteria bacterium]|nr:multi-sensor signal transduction histidine kinase [Pseudomonadota bacterium]